MLNYQRYWLDRETVNGLCSRAASPAQQHRAPGEAAAHGFQQHQIALLDAAVGTATDSASGIEAAEVLPCRSTVTTTFSGAMPSLCAEPSMIRLLAWCGTNQSMSSALLPVALKASSTTSVIIATAW